MNVLLLVGGALLFVGIVVLVFGVLDLVEGRRVLGRRLATADSPLSRTRPIRVALEDGVLKRFDAIVTPASEEDRERIRQRLSRAGYRKLSAVRIYYTSKAILALALGVLSAILISVLSLHLPTLILAAAVIVPALVGNILPSLWVERQFQRRRQSAEEDFPDALDMLLVCIEAGLGIDQACRRVGEQIAKTSPVISQELKVINEELLAGKQRADVFHDFAERVAVNDIRAFTTVLRQSDEFGVSVAETLRVYAAEMRHKRVMRAEEKANLMPVKVAMGSIFFTVPPTMLIMAGPSMIMLLRAFAKLNVH